MKAVSCRLLSSFNDMPAKITKRNYYGLCLVIILRLAFCVWETAPSKDFSTELTFCPDTTGSNCIHPDKAPFSGGGHLPEGVLLGILGGGVPPGSPNPDTISDQKMSFSTPVFRPVL